MGGEREQGKDLQGAAVGSKQQAADAPAQALINPAWMPAPTPPGQDQQMIQPAWMTPQQQAAASGPPQQMIQPAWAPQGGAAAAQSQPLSQLDPGLVALAKGALGADMSYVTVSVMPQLQSQGKRGMAQGGERIGLSPAVMSNPRPTLAHELIHIAQHPSHRPPRPASHRHTPALDVEQEAIAYAPKLLAGHPVSITNTVGDQILYQDQLETSISIDPLDQLRAAKASDRQATFQSLVTDGHFTKGTFDYALADTISKKGLEQEWISNGVSAEQVHNLLKLASHTDQVWNTIRLISPVPAQMQLDLLKRLSVSTERSSGLKGIIFPAGSTDLLRAELILSYGDDRLWSAETLITIFGVKTELAEKPLQILTLLRQHANRMGGPIADPTGHLTLALDALLASEPRYLRLAQLIVKYGAEASWNPVTILQAEATSDEDALELLRIATEPTQGLSASAKVSYGIDLIDAFKERRWSPSDPLFERASRIATYGPETSWPADVFEEAHRMGVFSTGARSVEGDIAETEEGRAVTAYLIPGQVSERVMVISGVHGEERGAIESCRILLDDYLLNPPKDTSLPATPYYTVVVIPTLFPDNAARESKKARDSYHFVRDPGSVLGQMVKVETNRNFQDAGTSLSTAQKKADAEGLGREALAASQSGNVHEILPENIALMQMIERFRPFRIISMHGTSKANEGGFFKDFHHMHQDAYHALEAMEIVMTSMGFDLKLVEYVKQHYQALNLADHKICIDVAKEMVLLLIDKIELNGVPNPYTGIINRKGQRTTQAMNNVSQNVVGTKSKIANIQNSQIGGVTKTPENGSIPTDGNPKGVGVSLGTSAPTAVQEGKPSDRPSISTITVETMGKADSSDPDLTGSQAAFKRIEMIAMAQAIYSIFLNKTSP